jgi:surface antigen
MRTTSMIMAALGCAACLVLATHDAHSARPSQAPPEQSQSQGACREFTMPITVGGRQVQGFGEACEQADGTWRITQEGTSEPSAGDATPPPAVYPTPYPAPYPTPYWAEPWWGAPAFVGGSVVFVHRFHRFPHRAFFHDGRFHRAFIRDGRFHRDFFHDGFRGGFHSGFHGGHR